MHSTILHKRSGSPGSIPDSAALSAGEIALNTADGKLFLKAVDNSIKTFINVERHPLTLNLSVSSVNFQYGNNTVTGILAGVFGGINNDISGAGSSVINGSDNNIQADYAFIGCGADNNILTGGDYGAILGGQNNNLNHQDSFIIGSNITTHLSGFTYVNNLSVLGKVYGDGSELTGVAGGGSYLPLAGGDLTGAVTSMSTISSSDIVYASGERVVTGESTDATPVHKIRAMSQATYDALGTYDPNTIYFITQ